jgi:hypothetical protein
VTIDPEGRAGGGPGGTTRSLLGWSSAAPGPPSTTRPPSGCWTAWRRTSPAPAHRPARSTGPSGAPATAGSAPAPSTCWSGAPDPDWVPPWEPLTPLDAAARGGADDLVAWLRTRGARPAAELRGTDPPGSWAETAGTSPAGPSMLDAARDVEEGRTWRSSFQVWSWAARSTARWSPHASAGCGTRRPGSARAATCSATTRPGRPTTTGEPGWSCWSRPAGPSRWTASRPSSGGGRPRWSWSGSAPS